MLRPSDAHVYGHLGMADEEIVDQAVSTAHRAYKNSGWSTQQPRHRAEVLRKWAELIEKHAIELARIESIGSTRPISQVLSGDIPYLSETLRFFAELADKHGGDVAATDGGKLGMTITEPYGVVAAILPWNFPLCMAGWKLGPILAAGNAVVLKPSEMTPFSVLRLAELGIKAGLPPGIFNIVQGTGAETGSSLVRHPDISKITFTGSTHAGAAIMADSARSGLKPVTLELGGKSPQLVFEDCDVELASQCIANAILNNAGQECVAGSRVIVHRNISNEVVDRLVNIMSAVKPGMTWSAECKYSPIISDKQLTTIKSTVDAAVESGGELAIGGDRMDAPHGAFFNPTILINVAPMNPAVVQEIFGPVLTVQTFGDEDEAVAMGNDSNYGLAGGVYTRDISRSLRVMRRLDVGTVWINRYGRSGDFIIPTGGFKQSGFGKDLGREAFEGNRRSKSVLIDID